MGNLINLQVNGYDVIRISFLGVLKQNREYKLRTDKACR